MILTSTMIFVVNSSSLFYVVTFILAFVYVPASVVLTLLLALFFALPGRRARSSPLIERK
ncbi:MAG: hypothetical protein JO011_11875 [Ktedonobacteraceae bacterium]|nr:hypothetical protein [Ktedonobacteraceae bacterium]